jgi:hypothetical protein
LKKNGETFYIKINKFEECSSKKLNNKKKKKEKKRRRRRRNAGWKF